MIKNITHKYKLNSCITSVVYDKKETAEKQKQWLDQNGCCGVCNKYHTIEEIKDSK